MKILYSQNCNVEVHDYNDDRQSAQLSRLLEKVVGSHPIGRVDNNTTIYIPYQDWIDAGGCGSVILHGMKLVHGLDKPTTDISHLKERRRRFLVPDQASNQGYVYRTHMAAHYKADGRVRVNMNHAYCGEVGTGEKVVPALEFVTCPECLQELKSINQQH